MTSATVLSQSAGDSYHAGAHISMMASPVPPLPHWASDVEDCKMYVGRRKPKLCHSCISYVSRGTTSHYSMDWLIRYFQL